MPSVKSNKNMPEVPQATLTPAEPDLRANLDFYEQHVGRIQQIDVSGSSPQRDLPAEFYASADDIHRIWDIKGQLLESGTAEDAVRFFSAEFEESKVKAALQGREAPTLGGQFRTFVTKLGEEGAAGFLAGESEDGLLHEALLKSIQEGVEQGLSITSDFEVLHKTYGMESASDLFGLESTAFGDAVRRTVASKHGLETMFRFDNPEGGLEESDYIGKRMARAEWMAKALGAFAGVGAEQARDYVFSASPRGDFDEMLHIMETFEHFGLDRLDKISRFTGIYGLEKYSVQQLERMEHLIDDPKTAATELAGHDVVVSMINGVGDYNGIMHDTPDKIEDGTGRVLFFEINSMTDIYRVMARLGKAGIHPSTVMLSAHSGEGKFIVADDRDPSVKRLDAAVIAGEKLVEMANTPGSERYESGTKGFSMNGMTGFGRMIEHYMTPSKGVEDPEGDIGRKKIIFNSCFMGKVVPAHELDEHGVKQMMGEESVASQIANDLVASSVRSSVDIYGASDGIAMHRTGNGLRYSTRAKVTGQGREPLPATRVRLEAGKVSQSELDEIALRKVDAGELVGV
jgi:hypothetical protein